LDTPERRAALERRLRELAGQIGDEMLRRHYQQELADRLARVLGRARDGGGRPRDYSPRRREWRGAKRPGDEGPMRIGPALANSPLFRGVKTTMAPREALILLILINHPDLIAPHTDELATLDLHAADAGVLRDALLRWVEADGGERLELRRALAAAGLEEALARLEGMAAHATLWSVRPESASADAGESLRQALVLHRRASALNRELRAVEARLAENPNEQDAARLRDIQTQLSALDGAEAAVEGYGALSGRASRNL
jgi:DNA primase